MRVELTRGDIYSSDIAMHGKVWTDEGQGRPSRRDATRLECVRKSERVFIGIRCDLSTALRVVLRYSNNYLFT